MERRRIPETENKLVILYALRALGAADSMQLIRFLAEMDLMNYFTMQIALSEMEAQGQIILRSHAAGRLIHLTPEGEFVLDSYYQRIPRSRRELMDAHADAWRQRFRTEQMTPADAVSMPDGRSALRLRLLDGELPVMEILLCGEDLPRTFLEKRWQQQAQTIHTQVYSALMEGFSPDAPLPREESPALIPIGESEWLLSLQDDPESPAFALALPVPDEQLARWCLSRWPLCHRELRAALLAALHGAAV